MNIEMDTNRQHVDLYTDFDVDMDIIDFSDEDALLEDFDGFQSESLGLGGTVLIDTDRGTINLQNVTLDE